MRGQGLGNSISSEISPHSMFGESRSSHSRTRKRYSSSSNRDRFASRYSHYRRNEQAPFPSAYRRLSRPVPKTRIGIANFPRRISLYLSVCQCSLCFEMIRLTLMMPQAARPSRKRENRNKQGESRRTHTRTRKR